MINLSFSPPRDIAIAVSGGADSMAALDFLRRSRNVTALHFNHGTKFSDEAESVVRSYCEKYSLSLIVGHINKEKPKGRSTEDFWREERYNFFEEVHADLPVITCHHLDDVVETWLFTSLHGKPRLIPHMRDFYLRPFLETRKSTFEDWCDRKNVPSFYDVSNSDTSYMRNYIRHEVVPKALRVNPGLHKVLRKKLKSDFSSRWTEDWTNKSMEMT
jgi:tRNA(Ile)-lysidine synthase